MIPVISEFTGLMDVYVFKYNAMACERGEEKSRGTQEEQLFQTLQGRYTISFSCNVWRSITGREGDGIQDMLPQSTAPWHIEYLRLKELGEMAEARKSL